MKEQGLETALASASYPDYLCCAQIEELENEKYYTQELQFTITV
jgi:hypothetical protein